ncbi:Glycerophosphoinositol permease 1 [Coccomyxa sp. Obi]|nr:Glycerophosphoinositol permease 1 [Coccomyxa sp. Obi]
MDGKTDIMQESVDSGKDAVKSEAQNNASVVLPPERGRLTRFGRWVWSWAVPGLGMFNESYYIFSVGNVKPIWTEQYPECWKEGVGCSQSFLHALNYSQVAGLCAGMIALGLIVDRIGRKWGSVSTALIMFVAGVLLTSADGPSAFAVFAFLTAAQALFGFGCGGEFPVAAASASERAESSEKLRSLRGQTTVLVFAMQGWGNILNLAVLLFFLGVQGQTGPQYSFQALSITWRMQYALGLLPIIFMLFYRTFYLKESTVWQENRKKKLEGRLEDKQAERRESRRKLWLLLYHYWHRLLGTALGWFAWDFYYYGNKLFQSEFINVIHPGSSLVPLLEYNLLNSSVALFGYYFAAFTIDKIWMGRRRMQIIGFAAVFVLFLACGLAFYPLTASAQALQGFQAMYYISSVFAQFVNATTFLLASELFPTENRGMAHGISAAVGKLGALSADIIMGQVDDRMKFILSAAAGALGVFVTFAFIPEITTLDLKDGDMRWEAIKRGEADTYTGEAVNPANLSWCEGLLGVGRAYRQGHNAVDDTRNGSDVAVAT